MSTKKGLTTQERIRVKPRAIPELKGQVARQFQMKISQPPSRLHKQIQKEADETYKRIKRIC